MRTVFRPNPNNYINNIVGIRDRAAHPNLQKPGGGGGKSEAAGVGDGCIGHLCGGDHCDRGCHSSTA